MMKYEIYYNCSTRAAAVRICFVHGCVLVVQISVGNVLLLLFHFYSFKF